MLNRTTPPKFYPPEFKPFTYPLRSELPNGLKVYSFNSGNQAVFKIELIFSVGSSFTANPALPSMCVKMLREGSKSMSALEISNKLDYYGAFLHTKASIDSTIISLFGRTVFINDLIPLLAEMIFWPMFNEDSIKKHQAKMTQKLLIDQEKTTYWAPRLLRKSIFGKHHPYSKFFSATGINAITRRDLVQYHHNILIPGLEHIIVAGAYREQELSTLLIDHFSNCTVNFETQNTVYPKPETLRIEPKKLPHANQASIAVGKPSIKISQENYPNYAFLTKILGGYFGSRLMKKLREDEGLTYGIHAFNIHLNAGSYLQISADVELNSVNRSIDLVEEEINKLRIEAISTDEAKAVKSYMIGEFVNDANTVFDFADLYKSLIMQRLPEDYYQTFYQKISVITPEEIKLLANETLEQNQFSVIKVS
jgi:zinc protease